MKRNPNQTALSVCSHNVVQFKIEQREGVSFQQTKEGTLAIGLTHVNRTLFSEQVKRRGIRGV